MMNALGPAHFPLEGVHKTAVIRQSRQRVMRRLMTNLVLVSLAVGHIDSRADATDNFSRSRAQRPQVYFKIAILVPILEVRSNAVERLRVLRNGRRALVP